MAQAYHIKDQVHQMAIFRRKFSKFEHNKKNDINKAFAYHILHLKVAWIKPNYGDVTDLSQYLDNGLYNPNAIL